MTIKKWLYLLWTTTLIGTAAAVVTGLLLISIYNDFSIIEVQEPGFNFQTIVFILISGALFGMVSLTGYFSYLILRYIALGIFRKKWVWDILQVSFIVIAFIDMIFLRYAPAEEGSWIPYTVLPLFLLAVAVIVSYWKVRLTQKTAFLPTLMFMFVGTILESIQAIRTDSVAAALFMIIPLLVCNAWQILIFHKLLQDKKELSS